DQYRKACYRAHSVLRYAKVFQGDGYVDHRDWLSLLLSAAVIGLVPFVWVPGVAWALLGCLAGSALLQVPVAAFAIRDTGDWRQALIVPIFMLRGLVWAVGGAAGLLSRIYRSLINFPRRASPQRNREALN
ncbi:MAG: hypothetical protein ACP5KN_03705, partial [Armatimonadota bacterium]